MCNTQLPASPERQELLKLHLDSNNWPSDVARQLDRILLACSFMRSGRQLVLSVLAPSPAHFGLEDAVLWHVQCLEGKKNIFLHSGAFSCYFFSLHFKPRLIFVVIKCHCDGARAYNSAASGSHFLHSESEQEAGLVDT